MNKLESIGYAVLIILFIFGLTVLVFGINHLVVWIRGC